MAWDGTCAQLLQDRPSLSCLAIYEKGTGTVYGATNEGMKTPEVSATMLSLCETIKGTHSATSFSFLGDKYIVLRKDEDCLLAKSGKKVCYVYLCEKLILVGVSEDTEAKMNAGAANQAMDSLCKYYKSINY
ncbi:hypothetical protein AAHC03_013918 [Spirometra sp. Aus1]|nr:unnamed protein product [Spirometra erinaceieuropaei]